MVTRSATAAGDPDEAFRRFGLSYRDRRAHTYISLALEVNISLCRIVPYFRPPQNVIVLDQTIDVH